MMSQPPPPRLVDAVAWYPCYTRAHQAESHAGRLWPLNQQNHLPEPVAFYQHHLSGPQSKDHQTMGEERAQASEHYHEVSMGLHKTSWNHGCSNTLWNEPLPKGSKLASKGDRTGENAMRDEHGVEVQRFKSNETQRKRNSDTAGIADHPGREKRSQFNGPHFDRTLTSTSHPSMHHFQHARTHDELPMVVQHAKPRIPVEWRGVPGSSTREKSEDYVSNGFSRYVDANEADQVDQLKHGWMNNHIRDDAEDEVHIDMPGAGTHSIITSTQSNSHYQNSHHSVAVPRSTPKLSFSHPESEDERARIKQRSAYADNVIAVETANTQLRSNVAREYSNTNVRHASDLEAKNWKRVPGWHNGREGLIEYIQPQGLRVYMDLNEGTEDDKALYGWEVHASEDLMMGKGANSENKGAIKRPSIRYHDPRSEIHHSSKRLPGFYHGKEGIVQYVQPKGDVILIDLNDATDEDKERHGYPGWVSNKMEETIQQDDGGDEELLSLLTQSDDSNTVSKVNKSTASGHRVPKPDGDNDVVVVSGSTSWNRAQTHNATKGGFEPESLSVTNTTIPAQLDLGHKNTQQVSGGSRAIDQLNIPESRSTALQGDVEPKMKLPRSWVRVPGWYKDKEGIVEYKRPRGRGSVFIDMRGNKPQETKEEAFKRQWGEISRSSNAVMEDQIKKARERGQMRRDIQKGRAECEENKIGVPEDMSPLESWNGPGSRKQAVASFTPYNNSYSKIISLPIELRPSNYTATDTSEDVSRLPSLPAFARYDPPIRHREELYAPGPQVSNDALGERNCTQGVTKEKEITDKTGKNKTPLVVESCKGNSSSLTEHERNLLANYKEKQRERMEMKRAKRFKGAPPAPHQGFDRGNYLATGAKEQTLVVRGREGSRTPYTADTEMGNGAKDGRNAIDIRSPSPEAGDQGDIKCVGSAGGVKLEKEAGDEILTKGMGDRLAES